MEPAETNIPHSLRNQAFALALLDPDTPIPDGVGKQGTEAPKRFSVYRNNVVVSLMEAMKAAYPSIATIMGEENFGKVSRNFIANHPPSSPMMQHYGREFPEFLKNFKPLQKSPFLKDVAQAEMVWLQSYHAVDETCLSPEDLSNVDPSETLNLTFEVHAAGHMVRSAFPVFDLFNARNLWPCPSIDLEQSQAILISRPEYECIATPLENAQAGFFQCLFDGQTLAEAIGAAMELDEAFEPAQSISIMLQTGIFKKPISSDPIG